MKKTILFLLPSFELGGAEKVMVTLYNHIDRKKFEPYFCVFKNGLLYERISEKNNVTILNKNRVLYGFFGLLEIIHRKNIDIVFSTHSHLNAIVCLMKKIKLINSKVVIRESNFLSIQQGSADSFYEKYVITWLIKQSYSVADHIICQTEEMKKDLALFIPAPKIHLTVIYNPLEDIPEYVSSLEEQIVISIGRLEKQKNHKLLVEAFGLIKDKVQHDLIIIGEGSERDHINHLIKTKQLTDRVKLTGFVEDVWGKYKSSSLFVLSSNFEGFPNVIIEAMANSIPVISTNCLSGPKEIIEDNVNGMLSPIEDKKVLSEKMLLVLENKKFSETIRNNAYNYVGKYSINNIVKEYELAYLS